MPSRLIFRRSVAARRSRAVLRSSSALGLVVSVLAVGALDVGNRATAPARGELFELELGHPARARSTAVDVSAPVAVARPTAPAVAGEDEFAFGPSYVGEAGGY